MHEMTAKYQCPACHRAILNRKIDRCLYCGETLTPALLLPQETVNELDKQQQELEERRRKEKPAPVSDTSSESWGALNVVETVIDVVSDLGYMFD